MELDRIGEEDRFTRRKNSEENWQRNDSVVTEFVMFLDAASTVLP
jgi:hypothetical protein